MRGLITKIQKFCVHDGPGIRTTVFFQGCPLRCLWCQNPEATSDNPQVIHQNAQCAKCGLCVEICPRECFEFVDTVVFNSDNCDLCGECITACPTGANQWSSCAYSVDAVMQTVGRDQLYYDLSVGGVTLSGGEPLRQFDFCCALAKELKSTGIHVTLDTSGYVPTNRLLEILPAIDLFLIDLKLLEDDLHKQFTGRSNELIIENLKTIVARNKAVIVRIPIIPGYTDRNKNIEMVESFVRELSDKIAIEHVPFNKLVQEKCRLIGKTCSIDY